ncbi:N-acetylneuraminate synthase family protein [Roseivirga sp. E12]|uniref:N-acetylneuraminate synthase family protein n=1 Tax=Roseivirga sp. E12 TaxID=2819237 RepID=UPI001ABD1FC3|nr:N-acetylneuraminate synthase family protein [Roseivirga sp. E12]MBO3700891.1 N-acetylneuraminate synthase family protein [Roseivirga sp. E12]
MSDFLLIAEIGQAHDGSLGILHSYIDAVANVGVKAIKFQTHIAEAESSIHEPFRVKFSYEDRTRYDYWKRMEFTTEQWVEIGRHCLDCGLEFISSPFSLKAVDVLEMAGVQKYKLGSGEVSNLLLLERICETGKPIIISSGLSNLKELDEAVKLIENYGNELAILQCTTAYPTKPEQWALNQIHVLKERYGHPIGFSDHSGDVFACISAANWGAEIFEFHITFDKHMFGPDAKASLTVDQTAQLVRGLKEVEIALNHPLEEKGSSDGIQELKNIFEKSLSVNVSLKEGDLIRREYLETKKPAGMGIPARAYKNVIGKKVNRNLAQWDFLKWDFLID